MSTDSLNRLVLRYKSIYMIAALILGVGTVVGGWWLGHLDGYHTEAKGLLLHVFGCAILYNDNNMYPSLWLMVIGLLVVGLTQYRARTHRKLKEDQDLSSSELRTKFTRSMAGLFGGLLVTVYGLTVAESGTNLCPATLVPHFPVEYLLSYLGVGVALMLVGIIILAATRFRIRIYKDSGIAVATQANG